MGRNTLRPSSVQTSKQRHFSRSGNISPSTSVTLSASAGPKRSDSPQEAVISLGVGIMATFSPHASSFCCASAASDGHWNAAMQKLSTKGFYRVIT